MARYAVIAGAALDRAETLRANEIAKARIYGERGRRVAARYRLPDLELRRVKKQIAALEGGPKGPARSGLPSSPEALTGVVERYVTEGETALGAAQLPEARRYLDIARMLARDYSLSSPGLPALGQRVAEAEQQALRLIQAPRVPTEASVRDLRLREAATPFLPPAF